MFLRRKNVVDNKIDVGVLDILEHQLDQFEEGERVDIVVMKYVKHPKVAPVKGLLYTESQYQNIACPKCDWTIEWRYGEDYEGDLYGSCCGMVYYMTPIYYKLDMEIDEEYVEEDNVE